MSSHYQTNRIDSNSVDDANDINVEQIDVNVDNSNTYDDNNNSNVGEITEKESPKYTSIPWYKNKKYRKIGLYAIIGVVICSLVIGLAVGLSKKGGDDPNNPTNPSDPSDPSNPSNPSDPSNPSNPNIPSIVDEKDEKIYQFKISTLYFNSTTEETIQTILELLGLGSDKKRRLKEINKTKTINSEYLFAIVSEPNGTNNYFTGYLLILNRNETLEGNNKSKYFDDSSNIDNDKNFNGVRVKFKDDGTIIEQLVLKDFNDLYLNEINDTIACIIPKYLNSSQNNLKKEDEKEKFVLNDIIGGLSLNDSVLVNSLYNASIKSSGENGTPKGGVFVKKIKLENGEYDKSNEKMSLTEDTITIGDELTDDITINGLIKSIETNSIQTIKFEKDGGEELAKKYKDKFEKLQWLNSSSSNRLRVLSKEEYEEKLKLQNEYGKNIDNLRNLADLGDVTESMQNPLVYKYEVFKTNALGFQFILRAIIEWNPTTSNITYKLSYQIQNTKFDLEDVKINIANYSKVIKSYKTLITTTISYLKENILKKIQGNFDNLTTSIKDNLTPFSSKLEDILIPLSKLYENYFQVSLKEFKDNIFKLASNDYQDLYKDLNIIETLEGIENSLIEGSEINLNNLISKAVTALNNIITNHKSNLKTLESNVFTFINKSFESINELYDYEKVGIDYYYRVKEIFHKIDEIMDSFNDNLADALDSEFLLLQLYVNDDIYMNQIDNKIDNVEIIWAIFKNNEILNETVTTGNAKIIVSKLELVRKKYENVINTFLNKIKNKYEELKNNNIKNGHEEIQKMKKNLNEKENILIELIKTKLLYLTNYEKYNEDIKKVTKVENEVSTIKLNAYKNNINNKLNEITTDLFLSSTTINNAKKKIEDEVELLKNNILNGGNNYQNNFNNILSKFTEFSSESNINKIIKDIKNQFSTEKLKTLVSNYYNIVIKDGISKYPPLVDEIINDSLNKYISKPEELINKIKGLINDTENNTEKENKKLQNLVNEKMKNILNDVISKIKNLINTEINYVRINLNLTNIYKADAIIKTGEFYNNSLNLINDLDNKKSNYLSQFNESLGLKTTIKNQEESINSKVSEVAENLRKKFYYLFCYENETLNTDCPNAGINTMDEYDQYYFQVSKFRDALNHLTLLQPYINEVINDNNLKDLSADKFLDLYKNPENFDANTIAGLTRQSLNDLINEGINITKSNVNSLKEVIKNSFTSGNNLTEQIFKNFFKNLISIKDLEKKLDLLFINVTKKARNGYTKDLNKIKNSEFFFNVSGNNLEEEYNRTWENYSNELKETKNRLLNNLVLTNKFNQKLIEKFENKIYNDINKYRMDLILYITKKKNCKLLDYEIVLTDIVEEAIIELKNNISTTIKTDLTKNALNDYNLQFNAYFKDLHDKINYHYRNLFDNYYNELTKKSNVTSTNKKEKLTDDIKNGFKEGIDLCKEELKEILNSETLSKSVDDDDKINSLLNDIFSNINLTIPNTNENINHNINDLNTICEKELKRENGIFKDEILEYIKLGFNETILNFMKGTGKSYLDGIFLDDYDVNIIPKLDYIHNQCKEIDEYLKLVIEGLFDVDSYLTDSVDEVYEQLKTYINDGITLNEINAKLIRKIEQFKFESSKKIVDYFKNYTLDILKSNSFKNMFSEQVQLLLPNFVPYTLILNFTIIFKEILDSTYLSNLNKKYTTNIINERNVIIDEIDNLKNIRVDQVGLLGQRSSSSNIALGIVEYNKLNADLSTINYKFSFNLTDDKKTLIDGVLLNSKILNYLEKIPDDYYKVFNNIQKLFKNNVSITVNLSSFKSKIQELKNKIENTDVSGDVEELKKNFITNLKLLYKDIETEVKKEYNEQTSIDKNILPINNRRRLDENVDIEIESIQKIINLIDISMINLFQNISNSTEAIKISDHINNINNAINVQLLLLNNTMESYLKFSRFYLESSETLNNYQKNLTNIYNNVENILKDFLNNQIEKIKGIYYSLDNYIDPYYNEVKPDLVEKINKVVKEISSGLFKYLNDQNNKGEEKHEGVPKKTDLTNLGGLSSILGSTRLNFSVAVNNTALQWGYEFKKNESNSKVYLNVYAGGNADATISYGNEFYNTSIAGKFGRGRIGMNITNNFSNDRVYIDYYTQYENYSYTQTLYELTTLDSWGVCEDAVDCFVGKNNDYCPYIVRIEDENKTIVNSESIDLDYYKNSSYYLFTGYYENDLCTFANYFYSAEETKYGFNSSQSRTI